MKRLALLAALLAMPCAYIFSDVQQVAVLSCGRAFVVLVALGISIELLLLLICVSRYYLSPEADLVLKGLQDDGQPSLSIQGCGYLYGFAAGVLQYMYEHFEYEEGIMLATSAGTFPAMALVVGTEQPIDWLLRDWPKCYQYYSGRYTGAVFQGTSFLIWLWDNYLPEDAHVKAAHMFRPVLTQLSFSKLRAEPFVQSEFSSRQHLLDTLIAGLGIPFITLFGGWYNVDGNRCVDGAFCVSAGKLNERTVLITPFRSCIRPSHFQYTIAPERFNSMVPKRGPLKRLAMVASSTIAMLNEFKHVFIPPDLDKCMELFKSGYEQAQIAHGTLQKAGWVPRPDPLPSRFLAWQSARHSASFSADLRVLPHFDAMPLSDTRRALRKFIDSLHL